MVALDSAVVLMCLGIVHRGQVTEVCRQLSRRRCRTTASGLERRVKSAHIPPPFLVQSTPTPKSSYTLLMHRHPMLLKHHADSHIDIYLSIYWSLHLSRVCGSSLDYQHRHFTVTAHFKSRGQMLKHKEKSSLMYQSRQCVFWMQSVFILVYLSRLLSCLEGIC